jgi:hypothetical protein
MKGNEKGKGRSAILSCECSRGISSFPPNTAKSVHESEHSKNKPRKKKTYLPPLPPRNPNNPQERPQRDLNPRLEHRESRLFCCCQIPDLELWGRELVCEETEVG